MSQTGDCVVGYVRQILGAGDPPLVGKLGFFGRRTALIRGREMEQVLIDYLGSKMWVNVDKHDILPIGAWDPVDCL